MGDARPQADRADDVGHAGLVREVEEGEAGGDPERKVIIRFHAQDVRGVAAALNDAGFTVVESVETRHPALAA